MSEVMGLHCWANLPPEVSMIQRNIVSLGNSGWKEFLKTSPTRGDPSGQATQALLALVTLSLVVPFTPCVNILCFNYFKGIFHTLCFYEFTY